MMFRECGASVRWVRWDEARWYWWWDEVSWGELMCSKDVQILCCGGGKAFWRWCFIRVANISKYAKLRWQPFVWSWKRAELSEGYLPYLLLALCRPRLVTTRSYTIDMILLHASSYWAIESAKCASMVHSTCSLVRLPLRSFIWSLALRDVHIRLLGNLSNIRIDVHYGGCEIYIVEPKKEQ